MADKLVCDSCKHEFDPPGWQRRRVKEITSEKVFRVFFACPKCKTEFHIYYETDNARRLMAQNRSAGVNEARQWLINVEQDRVKKLLGKEG